MNYVCEYCGGQFNHRENLWVHLQKEKKVYINGKEGIDYLICKECGLRTESLGNHIQRHGMTSRQYIEKHIGTILTLPSLSCRRGEATIGKRVIPIQNRSGAVLCDKCNEWYLKRFSAKHLADCVAAHPDKYELDKDYVKCPECGIAMSRLGEHLNKEHGWDKDRIEVEIGRGLKLITGNISKRWKSKQNFKDSQDKREATHLKRHGFSNPFSNPEVREKILETNQRRYGVDHPMKNEEVFIRQNESAHNGPSGQEIFFDEHTIANVVFCGYGGRFIRTKTGVHKYGRLIKDLNPDFIVLPDNVLESALMASRDRKPMDRQRHRSRYVIELLGDWYHSEAMIGINPEEHEKEIIGAYKSAGIECLVLWEKDVMTRWESIRLMVDAWVEKAVRDMNENPIWSRAKKVQ